MQSRLGLYRASIIVGLFALVMGAIAATSGANRQLAGAAVGSPHKVQCTTCPGH
jgi:hypothetical protein